MWTHFVEVERAALQLLAPDAFPFFTTGERTVHTDGHVEVASAFHPVPLAVRGVRAIHVIQGVLGLTRRCSRERVLAVVTEAHARQHFRYHTTRQLVERVPARPAATLATTDRAIRPMTQYTLEDFLR